MITKYFKTLLVPILALMTILACGPFAAATPQPAATLNALYTSAAQTLDAMSTQGSNTVTALPSSTATFTLATVTPLAIQTNTTVPPLQPVTRCDAASFISDVTYPDGSAVAPGSAFTKIWRVKNTGTCTWNSSYNLVYVGGERFGASNAVSVPGSVAPGQTIDLPVNLTAPTRGGSYIGYWKLRNPSGTVFGVGHGDASVYVDVRVAGYTVTAYDLLANYCEAQWSNGSSDLPCPGSEGDDRGFVIVLSSPKMEDGRSIGNGLLTYPERATDGIITGKYPNFQVENGDRFQTSIGCLDKANDCDMIYRLQYQIGNGSIRTLGQWREVYEGDYFNINVDLSVLSGDRVKLILTVLANGSSHEDYALWINPRITRLSSQPPTSTFTPTQVSTGTATSTATATATFTATVTPTDTPTSTETPTATKGP
ncbi:MAG TPA: NBR1-Ig-like domain-containing protein [Anaerolineales bacterium]|nr:NBR1-Ig-like domain-containing protein [Anaerolineales bacterium]